MEKQQGRWKRQIRWMKEGAKNFRLSLSLRVSLNYLRFYLINGMVFFFILGFLYLRVEMNHSMEIVEQMVVLLEMDEKKFVDFVVNEQPEDLAVYWKDGEETTILYQSGDEDWQQHSYIFGVFHYEKQDGTPKLLIKDKEELYRNGREYEVHFYYDASEGYIKSSHFLKSASVL